ncbi:hypothetical protein [Kitasatospora sp. NPDC050543]|uniref:hypothetical protein n=1 Tax=Kitasatospora sp. NPDC050543 TaxID=3364054 RepID=UPI0037A035F5
MNVGELVATFDIDASGAEAGEARAELALRNLQRSADGRLRDLRGRFASESQLMGEALAQGVQVGTDAVAHQAEHVGQALSEGLGHGAEDAAQRTLASMSDAELAVNGFSRSADGRIRDLRGRFISESTTIGDALARNIGDEGERATQRLSQGVGRASRDLSRGGDDGRRFGNALSSIGDAAGPIGAVVGRLSLVAGAVGSAIPVVAGLSATLAGIAPAAGIAATGLLAVASAGAAIKIGTGGIGGAIKAAFAGAPAAAGGASGAMNQVASAQRAVRDAIENAAYANAQAVQHVADAERNLTDAQKAALSAQNALTDARQQAAMDLEDLNNRLTDSTLGQRSAVLRAQTAQEDLHKVMADPAATEKQKAEAQLAYDEAVQHLKEQGTQVKRLQQQVTEANAAGVEGSQKVIDAQDRVAMAQRTVGDQTRAVQDAQTQQARTAAQGAEQVARAMEALHQGGAGAAGGGVDPLAAALAKLTPNARAFVEEIIRLKPAFADLKFDVQQALFAGLDATLRTTAAATLPVLHTALVASATHLNAMAKGVGATATSLSESGVLGQALASANAGLGSMAGLPATIVQGLVQVGAAAGPSFERLAAAGGGALARLSDHMATALASGGMQHAIEQAVTLLGQLGTVVGNVGSIIGAVFQAANTNGGSFVQTLVTVTGAMAAAFASPAVQAGLGALFQTVGLLAKTAAPLLGQALQALGPVIVALAPGVQALITALGPALSVIISALGPVMESLARAVSAVAVAFAPVLTLIGTLIGALLPVLTPLFDGVAQVATQLAPVIQALAVAIGGALTPVFAALPEIITPLVAIFTTMTGALLPILTQLIVALSPSIAQIADAFGQVMVALAPLLMQFAVLLGEYLRVMLPLLTPIISAVGKLASIFADNFAQALTDVVVPALRMVSQLLSGDLSGAAESAKEVFRGLKEMAVREFVQMPVQIMNVLNELADDLFRAGWRIIGGLIDGIRSRAGGVKDAVENVLSAARNLLPFSPAREGPFSGSGWSLYSGQSISHALAEGILSGQGRVRSATTSLMGAAHGGINSPFGSPQLAMAGSGGGPGGGGFGGVHIESYYAGTQSIGEISEDMFWKSKGRG